MNTRGSDQAGSKGLKKDSDQKNSRAPVKVPDQKAAGQPGRPSKSPALKETKAAESAQKTPAMMDPVVVKHVASALEEPPRRSIFKGTFNTHDIMHAPVEKTIQMLDKILAGERLFTM